MVASPPWQPSVGRVRYHTMGTRKSVSRVQALHSTETYAIAHERIPMPTQIEKMEAHAGHLLDVFIGLRERYALLHPMLFDQGTIGARGSGEQSRGFGILRRSLFLSCAQDIAKLSLDADERAPSILKIINALEDESLRRELEDRYARWVLPPIEDEADP